jgi:DNA-binding PadR family transcriptional regulator
VQLVAISRGAAYGGGVALEHAILVSLREQEATGFALAKRFDASIGNFWSASHQQIYRVLVRMQAAEHVRVSEHGREKSYAITAKGREELDRWCATASAREPIRSEFLIKLRAFANPDQIIADTIERRADHSRQLEHYLDSERRNFGDPQELSGPELGTWLALRAGIRHEREGIAFCDEILSRLDASRQASVRQ